MTMDRSDVSATAGDAPPDATATTLLVDHLRAAATAFPEHVAYIVLDVGAVRFAEWDDESNRLAHVLVDGGLQRGDRVILDLAAVEALRFMVAYAAVHKAGGVAVPVNPQLAEPELRRVIEHAEPTVALVDRSTAPTVAAVAPDLWTAVAPGPEADGAAPWSWGPVTSNGTTASIQVPVSGDDLADILYTSGTTGRPKGVAVRHRSAALIPGPPTPSATGRAWLHASPLFTFAGIGFVYNPMQLGMTGLYQPRFDAGRWLRAVGDHRPTFVFLVPAMATLLLDHPDLPHTDLSSIELCSIGSAPLPPAVLRALQRVMPRATVSNSYGMTEAGPAFCAMPPGEAERRVGSVGRPLPPLEVRIVDERGVDQPAGEDGEIWLRLPGRQREYYRDPEATAETWRDGWLRTGDLGRLDEDGFLTIVGRRKDVIIRGGNNVHAADVEAVLLEHPGVADAAVVGVPHPVLGEDVAAAVVPRSTATLDSEELRRHCAARLTPTKVPRQLLVVEDLPRNATGKVLKDQVRTWFSGDRAAPAHTAPPAPDHG